MSSDQRLTAPFEAGEIPLRRDEWQHRGEVSVLADSIKLAGLFPLVI